MTEKTKLPAPSVSNLAMPIVEGMVRDAAALRIAISKGPLGERRIDCGASVPGGLEAGRRMAEICLGGLGTVTLQQGDIDGPSPFSVCVHTTQPVIACLGSQYAGWTLTDGGDYYVLGSGPGRAVGSSEPLFEELKFRDRAEATALVLEGDTPPPEGLVKQIAEACNMPPQALTFLYAPTSSLAGGMQVVARVLEVSMHKAHELHFPLDDILDGLGAAPLPPPAPDFIQAMGRTNDASIFAGQVHLFVAGPDDAAESLANDLPSSASKDYGKPFAEIFEAVKGDFYAIDPMLFSPAKVTVTAVDSGKSFHAGRIDHEALKRSFG